MTLQRNNKRLRLHISRFLNTLSLRRYIRNTASRSINKRSMFL